MNSNVQKIKQGWFIKFIRYIFSQRLCLEQDIKLSNTKYIFQIVGQFQQLSMLVILYCNYFSLDLKEMTIICYLSKIIRPYTFMYNLEFMFLIPFCFEIIFHSYFILSFIFHDKKTTVQTLSQWIIQQAYIFYSIYFFILYIPFLEFSLYLSDYVGNLVLEIITFILVILRIIFEDFVQMESVSIELKNFNILMTDQSNIINHISALALIILNASSVNISDENELYLMCSVLIINSLIQLFANLYSYNNIYQNLILICITQSFVLTFSSTLLIMCLNKQQLNDITSTIIIMIYVPIHYILYNQLHRQHLMTMMPNLQIENADKIQYRIANTLAIIDKQERYLTDMELLIRTILNYEHIKTCSNSKCICLSDVNPMKITELFLIEEIYEFNAAIEQIKNSQDKFQFYIHQITLINRLGMTTKAFQQSNIIMYQDSSMSSLHHQIYQTQTKRENSQEQKSSSKEKSRMSRVQFQQIKLSKLNIVQQSKMLIVQEQIRKQISKEFYKKNQGLSDSLEHAVKLFLQSEEQNRKIKKNVLKMLNSKREYLQNLLKINNASLFFNQSKSIAVDLQKLENQLLDQYKKFPSQKMQALNAFYQAEINNNYYLAFKIANIASISDEKLLKMHSQTTFDLFSSRIDYFIVAFEQQNKQLAIKQKSNLAHEFFQMDANLFKQIVHLDALLPHSFDHTHQLLLNNFLQSGKSKYFRQIDINFCRVGSNYLKPINFFYDMDIQNLEDFQFVCFFQNLETQNAFMFVNRINRIVGITKNLHSKLGYDRGHVDEFNSLIYKQNTQRIFPHLQKTIENYLSEQFFEKDELKSQNIDIYGLQLKLPKQEFLYDAKNVWDHNDCLQTFTVDILLHLRIFEKDDKYYIIEIKDVKQVNGTSVTHDVDVEYTQNNIYTIEMSEEEAKVQAPKGIENVYLDLNSNNRDQSLDDFGIQLKLHNPESSFRHIITVRSPKMENNLISPVDNSKVDITNNKSLSQRYFVSPRQKSESSMTEQEKSEQNPVNQIDKLQYDDIDEELQENIRLQMQMQQNDAKVVHIDDIGSQVSSIAGIRTSRFYKKYEFIEKILSSKKFSKNFDLMLTFMYLLVILTLIQALLFILNSEQDLGRFLQELDMIQLRSNIIGPTDKFIVCLNILTYYVVNSVFYQYYNYTTALGYMQYAQKDLELIYSNLKQNFNDQITNPYLLPFFQDQYITVYQSNYPNISTRNISLTESLYLYLESNYNQKKIDFSNIITLDTTQSFLVYTYLNYQIFNEKFKIVNSAMLDYSVERSKTVKTKWNYILIPCLIMSGILLLCSFIFYYFYLKQYKKLMQFFLMIDTVWLNRDIDRYRGISQLVQKDQDVMFKYTFDLDLKEKFMMSEDLRKEKIAIKQRNSSNKQKTQISQLLLNLPLINSIIVFLVLITITFITMFLSNQLGQNYFIKYPDTTKFFNELSDLGIAISGIFAMRQLTYQINFNQYRVFFYFPYQSNSTYFLNVFYQNIDILDEFLSSVTSFDQSKYLTSQSFANQLQSLMQSDVCQFILQEKDLADPHCDRVYGGVLRRGFQPAFTSIRDALLNEYQSTQFLNQIYLPDQEMEAGLIGADVVNNLRLQFEIELISQTNDLVYRIQIISVVYMVYCLFLVILTSKVIRNYYIWEFNIVKRFLLLLPQASLLLDSQIERQLRQIIVLDNMI